MEFTILDWLLALLPLAAVITLMVWRQWSAIKAGVVGWLLAVVLAAVPFETGAEALGAAQLKALILTLDVSLIIWAALLLYAVVEQAGALAVIAQSLAALSSDHLIQILVLAWIFAAFLQSISGFGVPVAITAPLLVGLGINRVRAVILPSVGHGWSVTFGSLGIAFVMLSQLSDIPGSRLAPLTAFMLGVLCLISGLMVVHAAAGWCGIRQAWAFVLVVGLVMSATQYALALAGLYTLSSVGASLGGLVAAAGWIRWRSMGQTTPPQGPMSIQMALVGYAVLVLLALITGAITPVKSFLAQWAVAVNLPATETGRGWISRATSQGFAVPGHPGMVILYSALIAYLLYRKLYQPGATRQILVQSGRGALRALAGVLVMIAMAATMTYAGMIHVLACGLSQSIPGGLYAFVAALIGALGAVVTGSNVNSNAIFTGLQRSTADGLGLSPVIILAAQKASASVGSFFSPAKVAVGCSTVGANEGAVLRTLLAYGAILVLTVGIMAWIALLIV